MHSEWHQITNQCRCLMNEMLLVEKLKRFDRHTQTQPIYSKSSSQIQIKVMRNIPIWFFKSIPGTGASRLNSLFRFDERKYQSSFISWAIFLKSLMHDYLNSSIQLHVSYAWSYDSSHKLYNAHVQCTAPHMTKSAEQEFLFLTRLISAWIYFFIKRVKINVSHSDYHPMERRIPF